MVLKFPLNLQRQLMLRLFPFSLINPKTCHYVTRITAEHFNIMKQPDVQEKRNTLSQNSKDLRDHLAKLLILEINENLRLRQVK